MQSFNFSSRYNKTGKTNIIADALSRRQHLFDLLETKVLRLKMIKDQYVTDPNFKYLYLDCVRGPPRTILYKEGFSIQGE